MLPEGVINCSHAPKGVYPNKVRFETYRALCFFQGVASPCLELVISRFGREGRSVCVCVVHGLHAMFL